MEQFPTDAKEVSSIDNAANLAAVLSNIVTMMKYSIIQIRISFKKSRYNLCEYSLQTICRTIQLSSNCDNSRSFYLRNFEAERIFIFYVILAIRFYLIIIFLYKM